MAKPTFVRATRGAGSGTSLTVALDATGGDCLYVLTTVQTSAGTDVGGVTYAGVAMTQLDQQDMVTPTYTGCDCKLWRLVAPTTGTNNIVATNSPANSRSIEIHAVLLSGVYASDPDEAPVKDTDLSVAAGTVSSDQMVVACALVGDDSQPGAAQLTSTGTSQTERTDSVGYTAIYGSMATQVAEGSVTSSFTYAASADDSGIFTVIVNGAAPGGGGTPEPISGEMTTASFSPLVDDFLVYVSTTSFLDISYVIDGATSTSQSVLAMVTNLIRTGSDYVRVGVDFVTTSIKNVLRRY